MTQPNGETRTVFVVDDDRAVHRSMRWLLEADGFEVRTFESGEAFLEEVRPDDRGCLVLDVRMPAGMSGLQIQKKMSEEGYVLPIIVVSGHADIPHAVEAMREGALTFIEKPIRDEALLEALGEAFRIEADRAEEMNQTRDSFERYCSLTQREREVLWLVVDGKPNKQVASDLSLAEKTIEFHRANVMRKLEVYNLATLVRLAILVERELNERGIGREDDPRNSTSASG